MATFISAIHEWETKLKVLPSLCLESVVKASLACLKELGVMEAVKTVDLVKVYKGKETVDALKGVNLSIKKGELFTLLGPNGAGKTTFLRIIATQLLLTKGEAYVFQLNVTTEPKEVRKRIAVVPQDVQTYGSFTPWEYCYYFSMLRGMSKSEVKITSEKALKAVDLWDLRNRQCTSLSGGERKRAVIASVLCSDADLLMLDEPTSGLDAVARRKVWAILREMIGQGRSILLTTHIMEEAEMLSDRLAVINKGMVVAEGTPQEIRGLAKEKYRVVVEGNVKDISALRVYCRTAKFGSRQIFYFKTEDEALELTRAALEKGLKAEIAPTTLEDVFVELVGREEFES
jgi:ABC-2 type transport system ATP-binding protein